MTFSKSNAAEVIYSKLIYEFISILRYLYYNIGSCFKLLKFNLSYKNLKRIYAAASLTCYNYIPVYI